ncbi:MAG: ribonuclease HI [Balneolales bacterium]|nr:ribonuclease HI [Balneolales bacterium]
MAAQTTVEAIRKKYQMQNQEKKTAATSLKPKVRMYTDGACSGNPGPGGWGVVLLWKEHQIELNGGEPATTNNRMEMRAVIEGLKRLKKSCEVTIFSDSALIINAFQKNWIGGWQKRGWLKADKKPVENKDLWLQMLDEMQRHSVSWVKVKGHSGVEFNERADRLAVEASKKV